MNLNDIASRVWAGTVACQTFSHAVETKSNSEDKSGSEKVIEELVEIWPFWCSRSRPAPCRHYFHVMQGIATYVYVMAMALQKLYVEQGASLSAADDGGRLPSVRCRFWFGTTRAMSRCCAALLLSVRRLLSVCVLRCRFGSLRVDDEYAPDAGLSLARVSDSVTTITKTIFLLARLPRSSTAYNQARVFRQERAVPMQLSEVEKQRAWKGCRSSRHGGRDVVVQGTVASP